jgi:hypothetical protein
MARMSANGFQEKFSAAWATFVALLLSSCKFIVPPVIIKTRTADCARTGVCSEQWQVEHFSPRLVFSPTVCTHFVSEFQVLSPEGAPLANAGHGPA